MKKMFEYSKGLPRSRIKRLTRSCIKRLTRNCIKRLTRSRISLDRQNKRKIKDEKTNNGRQNIIEKTNDRATRSPLQTGC